VPSLGGPHRHGARLVRLTDPDLLDPRNLPFRGLHEEVLRLAEPRVRGSHCAYRHIYEIPAGVVDETAAAASDSRETARDRDRGVGSAFARIACRRSFFAHCALADHEPGRPESVVATLDDARFSAHGVGASRVEDVARLVREARGPGFSLTRLSMSRALVLPSMRSRIEPWPS
jgi:hypothetical protein